MNCEADCLLDFLGLRTGAAKVSFTFAFFLASHQVLHFENTPALWNNLYCLQMDIFVVVPDHI